MTAGSALMSASIASLVFFAGALVDADNEYLSLLLASRASQHFALRHLLERLQQDAFVPLWVTSCLETLAVF
jgi:hypothetical protein